MLIAPIGRRPEGLRARIDRILGFQASELDHAVGIGRVGPKIFDLADMIEILDAAAGDVGHAHAPLAAGLESALEVVYIPGARMEPFAVARLEARQWRAPAPGQVRGPPARLYAKGHGKPQLRKG